MAVHPLIVKIQALYEEDPNKLVAELPILRASDPQAWDEYVEPIEKYSLDQLGVILEMVILESALLYKQFADDKEVQYVLQVIVNEGVWYTLVHKMDIGAYIGGTSTLAVLQQHLQAIDTIVSKMVEWRTEEDEDEKEDDNAD